MIIHRMTACFGALENRTLELADGLNVLYAPNESGKSTWCAFLRVMLYGVSTAEREKQGAKPDKVKYAPWSGSLMSGSLDLSWRGRAVTLRRWTARANQPMQEFSATLTGTDEPVPGLTADNAGETLTGVSRDVFERSAFIRQGGLGVTNSAELEKRINALVSSGDESVSYTETDKRLRAWQRRRRSGKRGLLPELEEQMAGVSETLRQIRASSGEVLSLEEELSRTKEQKQQAVRRMEQARAAQRKAALEDMARSRRELQSRLAAREELTAAQAEREAALQASVFAGRTPEDAAAQAEDVKRRARGLEGLARRTPPMWLSWAALGLGAVLLAVSGLLGWSTPWLAAGLIGLMLFVVLYFRLSAMQRFAAETREDREKLLAAYGTEEEAGVDAALARYQALWKEKTGAAARLTALDRELEAVRQAQQDADQALVSGLDFLNGDTEAARAGRDVTELETKLETLREARAVAEGRVRAMGDPMVLESELTALRERYEELTGQYEALELAAETLSRADTELRGRFSPQLGKRAAELFAGLTDGRYDEVTLARDLSAKARRTGETVGRETDYLSEGAADQLYLALRLAVCELALADEEPCPLTLDDALVNFDEERTARALLLLRSLAEKRQILLFTCHEKETLFFADDAAVQKTSLAEGKAEGI